MYGHNDMEVPAITQCGQRLVRINEFSMQKWMSIYYKLSYIINDINASIFIWSALAYNCGLLLSITIFQGWPEPFAVGHCSTLPFFLPYSPQQPVYSFFP